MNRTKLFFGIMILFFLSILLLVTLSYNQVLPGQLYRPSLTGYSFYAPQVQEGCRLSVPENKTIIVRVDDYRAYAYYPSIVSLTEAFLSEGIPISIGVIPQGLEKDRRFLDWLLKAKSNERIEIALHGWNHSSNEFKNLSKSEAQFLINQGITTFKKTIGLNPVTFIPPYNEYSKGTVEALSELNFKVVSAGEDEYRYDGRISYVGYNAHTFNYTSSELIDKYQVLDNCKQDLQQKNLCIVLFHVQDYLNDDQKEVDPEKYDHLVKIIQGLNEFEAEYKQLKDLVTCSGI